MQTILDRYRHQLETNHVGPKVSIASFHFSTGHNCLAAHIKKINITALEECPICREPNA